MTIEGGPIQPRLRSVARRYALLAEVYDLAPLDFLVHAKARRRATELLALRPGQIVLDVACGTGVNMKTLRDRVGDAGRVLGIDYSQAMLKRARAKAGVWSNVALLEMDATHLSADALRKAGALDPGEDVDAAICTLGLSVIPQWDDALRALLATVRQGGRISIMDNGYPRDPGSGGELVMLRPFWWLACRVAKSDPLRRPWLRLAKHVDDVVTERFAAGYVGVAAGTVRH